MKNKNEIIMLFIIAVFFTVIHLSGHSPDFITDPIMRKWIKTHPKPIKVTNKSCNNFGECSYTLWSADGSYYNTGLTDTGFPDEIK